MLKQGKNIFTGSVSEAMQALCKNMEEGKEYFTGCDNEGSDGMCAGHPDDN